MDTAALEARPEPGGSLTEASLVDAVEVLAARNADLRRIVDHFGPPPLWGRPQGYATLVKIILEQQVSLSSAQAAFDRLRLRLDPLTPAEFLRLSDAELLAIGFSRQKARYVRALSTALVEGTLDLAALDRMDDEAVERELLALPGVGPWTVTIYRLMALRRPDAWPASDIALAQSLAEVRGLPSRPTPEEMTTIAEAWRPWRAVAARILWHAYLETRAERRAARQSSARVMIGRLQGPVRCQRSGRVLDGRYVRPNPGPNTWRPGF